jgi:hypothetical protein
MLSGIHSILPSTEHIVVAGYSFPPADLPYLKNILVPEIISKKATVEIINPENGDDDFRQRVQSVFPRCASITFGESDFRKFCNDIPIEYPNQPSLDNRERAENSQQGSRTGP